MDNICDGIPSRSEAIDHCGGDEKNNDHAEPTQSNANLIYEKIKIKLNDKHHFGFSQLHKYARNKPNGSTCE